MKLMRGNLLFLVSQQEEVLELDQGRTNDVGEERVSCTDDQNNY